VHAGSADDASFSEADVARALSGDPPRLRALLAEDSAGAAGFVTYTVDFAIWTGADVLRVDDVFVSARARGRGIGRQMMTAIAGIASIAGMSTRWEIEPKNQRAQQFYRGLGVEIRDKLVARWSLEDMRALCERKPA
jgi:GNAT superfamily N-acetyltransferase